MKDFPTRQTLMMFWVFTRQHVAQPHPRHLGMEGETYFLDDEGTRLDVGPGDRVVIPAGAVHAEGAVATEVRYIVGHKVTGAVERLKHALVIMDPASTPGRPVVLGAKDGESSLSEAKQLKSKL